MSDPDDVDVELIRCPETLRDRQYSWSDLRKYQCELEIGHYGDHLAHHFEANGIFAGTTTWNDPTQKEK